MVHNTPVKKSKLFTSGRDIDGMADLFMQNPFVERMGYLLQNPQVAKAPYGPKGDLSNCFGTVLFVTGHQSSSRPTFVSPTSFSSFLKDRCIPQKREGSIMVLKYKNGKACHAGIFLGEYNGISLLFHQEGCGKQFKVEAYTSDPNNYKNVVVRPPQYFYSPPAHPLR